MVQLWLAHASRIVGKRVPRLAEGADPGGIGRSIRLIALSQDRRMRLVQGGVGRDADGLSEEAWCIRRGVL